MGLSERIVSVILSLCYLRTYTLCRRRAEKVTGVCGIILLTFGGVRVYKRVYDRREARGCHMGSAALSSSGNGHKPRDISRSRLEAPLRFIFAAREQERKRKLKKDDFVELKLNKNENCRRFYSNFVPIRYSTSKIM